MTTRVNRQAFPDCSPLAGAVPDRESCMAPEVVAAANRPIPRSGLSLRNPTTRKSPNARRHARRMLQTPDATWDYAPQPSACLPDSYARLTGLRRPHHRLPALQTTQGEVFATVLSTLAEWHHLVGDRNACPRVKSGGAVGGPGEPPGSL